MRSIFHLFEDFMEQPIIVKAFLAWGWLSVLLMLIGVANTDWSAVLA